MPDTSFAHRRKSTVLERCQEAVRRTPEDFEAHFNLGMAYSQHGCYEQALTTWQRAALLRPDNGFVRLNIGSLHGEREHWEEARQSYQEAVRLFRELLLSRPERVEGYYGLGMAYGHLNQYDLSIEAFELALLIQSELPDIHYGLAIACLEQGQHERAIQALQETLRLDPKYPKAQEYLNSACELRDRTSPSPQPASPPGTPRRRGAEDRETSETVPLQNENPELAFLELCFAKSGIAPQADKDRAIVAMRNGTSGTEEAALSNTIPPEEPGLEDTAAPSGPPAAGQDRVSPSLQEETAAECLAESRESAVLPDQETAQESGSKRADEERYPEWLHQPQEDRAYPDYPPLPHYKGRLLTLAVSAFLAGGLLVALLFSLHTPALERSPSSLPRTASPISEVRNSASSDTPKDSERISTLSVIKPDKPASSSLLPPQADTASEEATPTVRPRQPSSGPGHATVPAATGSASAGHSLQTKAPASAKVPPSVPVVRAGRTTLPKRRWLRRPIRKRPIKAGAPAYDKGVDALLNRLP
jgi:Flp pilus assembly protein TadD